jgi:flavin-dependent dehydrogenase
MPASYDAIVIGGGLAGCSAALQLARRDHRVLLLEKGTYPQHKLCGEFLSPEVQGLCDDLGVLDPMHHAGAHAIRHARVTTADGVTFESDLPGTALGLSRYRLDEILFEHAGAAGADGRTGMRVRSVEGSLADGFTVSTRDESFTGRIVLGAYGKRGLLDRTLDRDFLQERSPFVAFKAHFEGASLPGQIELHAFDGGYCGLSHVEEGRVNVCWIAREDTLTAAGGKPEAMMAHSLAENDALAGRLGQMTRVSDTFHAISQISLARKAPFERDVCMIGDTAGMIAPLCGDGMAMALHSATLAVPPASDFLNRRITADDFRTRYATAWDRDFNRRMQVGRWAHHGYIRPLLANTAVQLCRLVPALGRWIIRATRG